jgi:hypothetical protein
VIYKNLLRDFRKFFVTDFNQVTNYIKKKRREETSFYIYCIKLYLVDRPDIWGQGKKLPLELQILYLGSLLYPKQILRLQGLLSKDEGCITFRNIELSESTMNTRGKLIISIYQSLYRFSLQRLHCFVNDPHLIGLFHYYSQCGLEARITRNHTLNKHRPAYLEAAGKLAACHTE